MLVRNLKLKWAELIQIDIKDIEDVAGRKFAGELSDEPRHVMVDVYVCSDGRNRGVRQVLKQIPYVNVMNTAGNVVYYPNERPAVIIAHGNSKYHNCGAVDHVRLCADGVEPKYRAIAENVKSDPIENAKMQLEKIPERYRAGIIYYNHSECRVEYPAEANEAYARKSHCQSLFDELDHSLGTIFTDSERTDMAKGQNPEIILLTNVHFSFTVYSIFRVDLQRDKFHQIVSDSMAFAVESALTGKGSFRDTKNLFMVFRKNRELPIGFEEFLNNNDFIGEFIKRGGSTHIVTVGDLPSEKTIFKLKLK